MAHIIKHAVWLGRQGIKLKQNRKENLRVYQDLKIGGCEVRYSKPAKGILWLLKDAYLDLHRTWSFFSCSRMFCLMRQACWGYAQNVWKALQKTNMALCLQSWIFINTVANVWGLFLLFAFVDVFVLLLLFFLVGVASLIHYTEHLAWKCLRWAKHHHLLWCELNLQLRVLWPWTVLW